MKKIILVVTILILSGLSIYAQDDIQQVQDAWGKDKKELVWIGMNLSPADSIKFWPVYDQYEKQRQKIGRERIIILNDYADNYEKMTNAKADELINRIFKNDAASVKLMQQYYGRMKTTLNAMQAAKFLHIETYLQTTIRSALQGALPMIGELDSLKTH